MKHRSGFIDVQEKDGFHLWMGVDEWEDSNGYSRRLLYERFTDWNQARECQLAMAVENRNMGVDLGHRYREVLRQCAEWKWMGYKGDEAIEFPHMVEIKRGQPKQMIHRPWSTTKKQDPLSGLVVAPGTPGSRWALSRDWSNPSLYPIFYALKNGNGRYYGIAKDMPKSYISGINAKVPKWEDSKVVWQNLSPEDHPWDVAVGNLLVAMIRGWFKIEAEKKKETE